MTKFRWANTILSPTTPPEKNLVKRRLAKNGRSSVGAASVSPRRKDRLKYPLWCAPPASRTCTAICNRAMSRSVGEGGLTAPRPKQCVETADGPP